MAQQFRKYLPNEIDNARLAQYYDLLLASQGYYYSLKSTVPQNEPLLPLLPQTFWATERTGGAQQISQAHSQAATSSSEPTVSNVRVVAHTTGPFSEGTQMSDNHWSMYLLTSGNSSVRVNMAADRGYITGQLLVTNHQYILSNSRLQHWDFAVNNGITLGCALRFCKQELPRRHSSWNNSMATSAIQVF